GDLDGRVRLDRRRLRQLRARAGGRSGGPGRCLRPGLSSAARVPHLRHRPAAAEDCAAEAGVMDAPTLLAVLQENAPGGQYEAAPSADAHPTLYVSASHLPAAAGVLRDHPDLRFELLADLTA